MAHLLVDAKGLACPMPIVKAKKAMDSLEPGQIMELHATDRGALSDFRAWVGKTGNELLEVKEEDGVYKFLVKKG